MHRTCHGTEILEISFTNVLTRTVSRRSLSENIVPFESVLLVIQCAVWVRIYEYIWYVSW